MCDYDIIDTTSRYFQLVILALRWLLKSLNDDEKFRQAEEECLKWLRWNDLPSDNPNRRGGYH